MLTRPASVQATRLGIDAIENSVVALPGGEYRAVLEVSGTASPLADDAREEGLLAGFATFLNALSYPIQILVRATPVDLSRYVASLEERGRQLAQGQLADLELAQLYLACWSPERARAQRFRQQLDDYTTLAVRAMSSEQVVE